MSVGTRGFGGKRLFCTLLSVLLLMWQLVLLVRAATMTAQPRVPGASVTGVVGPSNPGVQASVDIPVPSGSPIGSFSVRFGPNARTITPVASPAGIVSGPQPSASSVITGFAVQSPNLSALASTSSLPTGSAGGHVIDQHELDAVDASLQSSLSALRQAGLN
ncbi:hypothetical protein CCYA_CCYA05G1512 [Cyanidiococcus yangmingshanensis]|nr:hypothetical protein CCYA_CCYA05G1512 [Cyanidiococcus yangmingshanensis]